MASDLCLLQRLISCFINLTLWRDVLNQRTFSDSDAKSVGEFVPLAPTVQHHHVLQSFKHFFICMGVLPMCMSAQHMVAWCPRRPEKHARPPGAGVRDCCELPSGC